MKRKILDWIRQIFKIRILENILVKLTTNKNFGSFITKFPPNHYQYKKNTLRKVTRVGIHYELDLSDMVHWYIYFGFKNIAKIILESMINEGNLVFDVGANIGDLTLNMAKKLGTEGKVYAFEPDPTNFEILKQNISRNSLKNIQLNNIGFGSESGSFQLHRIDDRNRGRNRILPNENDSTNSSSVKISTIDNFVAENNISSIDLIKIDVEGFEYNVLKGAKNTLKQLKPKLFVEISSENLHEQGLGVKDCVDLLINMGYSLKHADTNKSIHSDDNFENFFADVIAI